MEPGIAHAVAVAMDVLKALSGLFGAVGVTAQRPQQIRQAAAIQFFVPPLSPELGLDGGGAVEGGVL